MDQESLLLVLLQSVVTDEAKQERLAEIKKEMDAVRSEKAEVEATRDQAHSMLEQAQTTLAEASRMKAEAEARATALVENEVELGKSAQAFRVEKDAFNAVRANVEREQEAMAAALHAREMKVQEREDAVTKREAEAEAMHGAAKALQTSLEARHARLRAALTDEHAVSAE